MENIRHLNFSFKKSFKETPAHSVSESGVVCLSLLSDYYGNTVELEQLFRMFSSAREGLQAEDLDAICQYLQLVPRVLNIGFHILDQVRTPCIISGLNNSFHLLKKVSRRGFLVSSPGEKDIYISPDALRGVYTGTVIEVFPTLKFSAEKTPQKIRWRAIVGKLVGLKASTIQVISLALSIEMLALVSPLFVQLVTDHALLSGDRELVIVLTTGFLLILGIQLALEGARSWALMVLGTTLNVQWRANTYKHLLNLPAGFFDKFSTGDMASRLAVIDSIQGRLTNGFVETVLDGVLAAATILIMAYYSVQLSLIGLISAVIYLAIRTFCYGAQRASSINTITLSARVQSSFIEMVGHMQTVKTTNCATNLLAKIVDDTYDESNSKLKSDRLAWVTRISKSLVVGAASILLVGLGALGVLETGLSIGMLLAFYAYHNHFMSRICALVDRLFEFKMIEIQGVRLGELMLAKTEPNLAGTLNDVIPDNKTLSVKNLRYRYQDSSPLVLDGLNFVLKESECLLITGKIGSGKTTLARTLSGVNLPQGEVRFGGLSFRQFGMHRFRANVVAVLQDDVLFAGTVLDNIVAFAHDADFDKAISCSKIAHAHSQISSLPNKYNSEVGEGGKGISAGLRARIMLARGLYQAPSVLILDEALYCLGNEEQDGFIKQIKKKKISCILLSTNDRLADVADRHLLLEKGKLVEAGLKPKSDIPSPPPLRLIETPQDGFSFTKEPLAELVSTGAP
ncbi:peptidase domain-containing ABC transporter [Uliginosibacterium sp. TH139]|uniref:peptidase domain-containing ABC transporter n=1 Tax=Uliginosibacterium sp. TH139 TaxID=2067453 RepID=UPI000C7DC781|nr:peptidase domain-containing ABC transporter [Uliginosibacterium sp. TH139]PLK48580.1 hypothetical protein C0V76_10990 [Uliginosibacterium sp. TH139]